MDLKCANCGKAFDEDDDILTITETYLLNQSAIKFYFWRT